MHPFFENLIAYSVISVILLFIILLYLKKIKKLSNLNSLKIQKAKEAGLYEPVSLHPVVDTNICIGSGACVEACPEKDILGLVNHKAQTINASRCVGHGACFHACPVQAITLCIGTEKRGVELPHISENFETNIKGIFIAGELGGMGLIKNAIEQGKQAVEYFTKNIKLSKNANYDLIIVGAGPAGIAASLTAKKNNLNYLTLEQDSVGGTVRSFPRSKIVMTSPVELPFYGKVKLFNTSKNELIQLWLKIINQNKINIFENEKVEAIQKIDDYFLVSTNRNKYSSSGVLLAIGRRGSPRKLGVPGEDKEKVFYRLLEPELIKDKNVLIVGGGDSAVESAILIAENSNNVVLSYRGENFSRLKPENFDKIKTLMQNNTINVIFNSQVKKIFDDSVELSVNSDNNVIMIKNDLVYVFIGGVLPTDFLNSIGIKITKKFGEPILKHE